MRTIRAEAWLPAVVVLAGSVLMFALAEPNELTDDPAAEHDRLGSTWAAVCGSRSVPRHRRADPGVLASVVFQPFSLAVAEWLACQPTSTIGKALAKPFYGVQRWRRGPLRAQAVGPSVAELRLCTTETASPQAALLSERYPEYEVDLRPTLLGNALFLWPRPVLAIITALSWPHLGKFLIAVLAEKGHDPTAAARAQIEVLTGLATAFGCVTVVGVVLLADERGMAAGDTDPARRCVRGVSGGRARHLGLRGRASNSPSSFTASSFWRHCTSLCRPI